MVDGLVPIEHLRLVEEVLDESEEVTYEVEKIWITGGELMRDFIR